MNDHRDIAFVLFEVRRAGGLSVLVSFVTMKIPILIDSPKYCRFCSKFGKESKNDAYNRADERHIR